MTAIRCEPEGQVARHYRKVFDRAPELLEHVKPENIIPHAGTLLVRMIPPDACSKGGIHIPEMAKKEKGLGVVVRAGSGTGYSEGDTVLFRTHSGQPVPFTSEPGAEYLFLQVSGGIDDEILAKIEFEEPKGENPA